MLNAGKPTFFASAAAFILLSAAAGARWLYPIDVWALHVAQHRTSETLDAAGKVFSVPGDLEYAATALVVLSAALFLGCRRVLAARLLTAFVVTGLIEFAMKMLLPQVPMPNACSDKAVGNGLSSRHETTHLRASFERRRA